MYLTGKLTAIDGQFAITGATHIRFEISIIDGRGTGLHRNASCERTVVDDQRTTAVEVSTSAERATGHGQTALTFNTAAVIPAVYRDRCIGMNRQANAHITVEYSRTFRNSPAHGSLYLAAVGIRRRRIISILTVANSRAVLTLNHARIAAIHNLQFMPF